MTIIDELIRISKPLGEAIDISDGPSVSVRDEEKVREKIGTIVRTAVFGSRREQGLARWLIRSLAQELGAVPASIHEFYLARGRGNTPDDFTVPAINLRALSFTAAKAVFRSAMEFNACALIFEIARSEMGYTDQRPTEYASNILGAAIAEGYRGPVFIQGDHFQVSHSRYKNDPQSELEAVRSVSLESIAAGFFNIDIDTSTLVDLSKEDIADQQELNYSLCADLAASIRRAEPEGVTISLGGEIGEVGGQNSTEPEMRAFMEGFNKSLGEKLPGAPGLSKISIQTGTSHGGVVLPDGSIAEVSVDFDTLKHLSAVAKEYGMGGAVQHGASTLPEEAFTKFAEANALEVHLATGFQNIMFDHLPEGLRTEMYAYLDENHSDERKSGQTDEQFYYKTRKRAIGPFKQQLWNLPEDALQNIQDAWQKQFALLFERLNIKDSRSIVKKFTELVNVEPALDDYLGDQAVEEDVSDLAD
ncbi:MAG: class II fructose-bisphosphate aldolase [Anaerolineales bacterium]|nr:class II fructose-bisphosphate aldolase [Anaerolineales bacterium]